MRTQRIRRNRHAAIVGLVTGALAGVAAVTLSGAAVAQRAAVAALEPYIEATHLPPLLTLRGERVELRFDVHCVSASEAVPDAACDAAGSLFVRAGDGGPFQELALTGDPDAEEGRYRIAVPDAIARSPRGFSYYAVLRDRASGATTTLPAGGSAAPQRSLTLDRPVEAAIGTHEFGRTRRASSRVVDAAWGSGPDEVGLEQGRNLGPIGGSSFDVADDGTVHVLDEANRRILLWHAGARVPERVPVAINGTLADMSVASDGTIHVLETTGGPDRSQLLRRFGPQGAAQESSPVDERASQVRIAADGFPVVLQQTSGQWLSTADASGSLSLPAQRRSGRAGRPLRAGGEAIVLRRDNEVRVALVGGGSVRSWRVTSATPLAEVQLAEPLGSRLLLVVRVFSDAQDEFVGLVLGDKGIVDRFSLDSADWAETSALSRFRLAGSSLYQLGSTPSRVFVDRFDLEVR